MIDDVKKLVKKLLEDNKNAHGYDHVERVLDLALKFSKSENVDIEILSLIALLHEVDDYKLFGDEYAANLTNARDIMKKCSISNDIQEIVCSEISRIGYGKRLKGLSPKTIEGKLASDADMCEALGVNGFLRAYRYGLSIDRPLFVRNSFPSTRVDSSVYNSKYGDSTITIVFEKLLKLKDLMLTNPGRDEALIRHKITVDILHNLFRELNAPEWEEFLNSYLK